MFDRDSRYAKLPVLVHHDAEGRPVPHVARRLIPDRAAAVAQVRVQPGDRLDLIAHRVYGDARMFWRLADANPDPAPDLLAEETGRKLRIAQILPE